jgi:imidazolonepropionase-like amidohydrolase
MVETAHRLGVKVAAHCVNPHTIKMLVENGVDTLEHGTEMAEELLPLLLKKGVAWTPTFAAYYSYQYPGSRKWDAIRKVYTKAVEMGVLVATGGDTGT